MPPIIRRSRTGIDYDSLAKLMALLVATIYVVGVVVVNLRLARFGISGMGLLREQYVFAGVWALLPILTISVTVSLFCASVIVMYPGEIASQSSSESQEVARRGWNRVRAGVTAASKAIYGIVMLLALAGGTFTLAINWALPDATTPVTTTEVLIKALQIALFAIGIGGLGVATVWLYRHISDKWDYVLASAGALMTAILTLGYLSFFAVSIYARIPSEFGGGADTKVRLLLNLDGTRIRQLGLSDDVTVRLLFVTNSMYYVISPHDASRAVGIPSSAVTGIETIR